MRWPRCRPLCAVPVTCVVLLAARAAEAQVVPAGPAYYAPATTPQTVYYASAPTVGVPAANVPRATPVAAPLYAAPNYPAYPLSVYPAPVPTEGPIQAFFRRLFSPLAPPPAVALPAVNSAPSAPLASGYLPASGAPFVSGPASTVVQRPVIDSPLTYTASPRSDSATCSCAVPEARAVGSGPAAVATGPAYYPPSAGDVRVDRVPVKGLSNEPKDTQSPRLDYNENRTTLPDNASRTGPLSVVPATHRQDRPDAPDETPASRPAERAEPERLDDSGWRAVH